MEAVRKEWFEGELAAWMRGGRVTRLILLLLNVVLALAIVLIWRNAPQPESLGAASDVTAAPLKLPASPFRSLSLTHYQELISRPLFWSERRVLENESTVPVTAGNQSLPFVLLGVVMSPQSNHALLGKPGSNDAVRVQQGDIVEGWLVESMTPNSVSLSRGGERQTIGLDNERSKP